MYGHEYSGVLHIVDIFSDDESRYVKYEYWDNYDMVFKSEPDIVSISDIRYRVTMDCEIVEYLPGWTIDASYLLIP